MLLVDFQNAFNLVDHTSLLLEVRRQCPGLSRWVEFCYSSPARLYYREHCLWSCQGVQQGDPLGPLLFALVLHPLICKIRDSFDLCLQAWYLDDGTVVGDTLVVSQVLDLILTEGPALGLHLNVDKTEVFWPVVDPRGLVPGVFPAHIARPVSGVTVLGGPVSSCPIFSSELVATRVAKTLELMDLVAALEDPQSELLLIRACSGISRLYFTLRTCPSSAVVSAQPAFDSALRVCLERIVTASGAGFGDWQWRLATLPFQYGGLRVYSIGDVMHYSFLASRLQSSALQASLLCLAGLPLGEGPSFDAALSGFNGVTGSDFRRDSCGLAASKLMKKLADEYFARIVASSESVFSLSPRQVVLWRSQHGPHSSDWLRAVPISGLGQTMNGRTYRSVLCYRLGIPLFRAGLPCSACGRVFEDDIFGDHAVSCSSSVGLKHRHNLVRDTLFDICFRAGISSGKEVDIGVVDGLGRPLRPADILLYSWDLGRDMCVDITGSSPLTQTCLASFAPGRCVLDASRRKCAKYRDVCSTAGYGLTPFSFSSFGELDAGAVALLGRIRSFSPALDSSSRLAAHIFTRVCFSIAKGVGAQLVSRLSTNFV
ncbi:hypothetical protein RND81_03G042700 [Saponaria officinalis]|uniref:Reverse transcriptase domain-containing protein n=1 Tax=Saponaria officinalis TaxID=3572 RepID=A0AAW1M381_SAPOF